MGRKPHFKATLTYLTTEEGGIVTPVSSGFRAFIKFPDDNREFIGNQTFLETEMVFPGDTVIADIYLLDAEKALDKIYSGLDFSLFIQSNLIGSGVVTYIYSTGDTNI